MAEPFRLGESVLPVQARRQVSTLAVRLSGGVLVVASLPWARSLLVRALCSERSWLIAGEQMPTRSTTAAGIQARFMDAPRSMDRFGIVSNNRELKSKIRGFRLSHRNEACNFPASIAAARPIPALHIRNISFSCFATIVPGICRSCTRGQPISTSPLLRK